MPLQVIESTDPLTQIVRLQASPVYEMVISLRSLLLPARQGTDWAARARQSLPAGFWTELAALYEPYAKGSMFFELAVDYPDHDDVPGFIEHVRQMDPYTFIFYVLGRVLPVERLHETGLEPTALSEALDEVRDFCYWLRDGVSLDPILAAVPAFQARLADLWQTYWEAFFAAQMPQLRPHWERGLRDKASILARAGGQGLLEYVTGKTKFPTLLPPDQPITDMVFIPITMMPSPVYVFYGYGNVTVLFDSERTEARRAEIERSKQRALAACKALGDGSRLDILRVIARHEGTMHGKQIAAKLKLSASAVSRHLAQLRDAGLIEEQVHDDRTITYRVQRAAIEALPETIFDCISQG